MRNSITLLVMTMLACVCAASSRAQAEDTYPYDAFIVADEAEVYSGPGRRFYSTEKLPRGTRIEIYRRDVAGWLAIRPPEGSFSWVVADHVEIGDEPNQAIVVEQTPSWIGTAAERVREHKHHLMLEPGEELTVLGKREVPQEDGEPQTWLKIAPPAGEFRWVHPRDISRSKPDQLDAAAEQLAARDQLDAALDRDSDAAAQLGMVEVPLPRSMNSRSEIQLASAEEAIEEDAIEYEPIEARSAGGNGIALHDLEPAARPSMPTRETISQRFPVQPASYQGEAQEANAPLVSSDGFKPRSGARPRTTSPATTPSSSPPTTHSRSMAPINRTSTTRSSGPPALLADSTSRIASPAAPAISSAAIAKDGKALSTQEVDEALAAIDVELALMLARNRREWNLVELERQTAAIVESASESADRGRARLMLEKIREFAAKFNVDTLADLGVDATASSSSSSTAVPPPIAPTTAAAAAADPKYDAVGWLKPVVTRQHQAAPYAIVDNTGRPICFVSPSPGLNLNRYVNKQVGLYGRRGYLEALKTPHVTAERVITLDRHLR